MYSSLKLLAIVGMPGSGKSVAADYFRSKNATILRFGDQTDIGLKEANLPINEENERMYREKLRTEFGMAAMAIKIEPRIINAAKDNFCVVLDGLYSWEEYIYLKKKFPSLTLLCIYAAPRARYRRLKDRKVRPLSETEARTRDYAEIENLHKGGPIAIADYLIVNDTDVASFNLKLSNFYRTFI
ncbi:MAG TPA: AAA family ATPase [Patescibacteria group bacterium]|nr:AAA family ATPase [Patescibacteria group bacterium]